MQHDMKARCEHAGMTMQRIVGGADPVAAKLREDILAEFDLCTIATPDAVGVYLDRYWQYRVVSTSTACDPDACGACGDGPCRVITLCHRDIWWLTETREDSAFLECTLRDYVSPPSRIRSALQQEFEKVVGNFGWGEVNRYPEVVMACRFVRTDGTHGWRVSCGDRRLADDLEPVFVVLARTETEAQRLDKGMKPEDWLKLEALIGASSLTATEAAMKAAVRWHHTPAWLRREIRGQKGRV